MILTFEARETPHASVKAVNNGSLLPARAAEVSRDGYLISRSLSVASGTQGITGTVLMSGTARCLDTVVWFCGGISRRGERFLRACIGD